MILNSPYISGSLTVTGNIITSGSITISGSIASSSYALTASNALTLEGLGSASFAPASTFNTVSQSYAVASGSLSTRVTNLEATSSVVSSSFATTSGSISGRVTLIEGQYATTGSNTFTGPQYASEASNAISFTSTASLYTDGGLRVAKDSFVSGTAYFNNITVYGTSSIEYITSSQVNIGSNIITVNTDTPAIRFGGLSVFDSGSTQLTGSIFWDSEKNHWIYSNPSGSSYNSGMIMSGPRNSGSLGDEQGTTFNALMKGQGGDHITSSQMFDDGTTVRIPGNFQVTGSTILSSTLSGTSATFSGNISTTAATIFAKASGTEPLNYQLSAITLGYDATNTIGWITAGGAAARTNLILQQGGGSVGIGTGTINGGSKLQVDSANGTAYSSNAQLRVSSGGVNNNRAQILFSDNALSDGKISYYPAAAEADRLFSISARSTESDFVIKGNGNVGIGTTAPNTLGFSGPMLSVCGTGQGQGLEIWRNSNTIPDGEDIGLITFLAGTSPFQVARIVGKAVGTSENAGSLSFQTSESAGVIERMRITSDGIMQISTTATIPSTNNVIYSYSSNGYFYVQGGTTGLALAGSGNRANAIYLNTTLNSILFHTNDTGEKMRITSGGDLLLKDSSGNTAMTFTQVGSNIIQGNTSNLILQSTGYNIYIRPNASYRTYIDSGTGLTISGSLSKGSGSFRIKHPLASKKNTHQLVHSFIEGPQADLIYRGKIRLIAGIATVNIDDAAGMTEGTFEALCRDVQCFTSNETSWGNVRGKVEGNILTIECQNTESTDEISWMVVGERKDEHMIDTEWTDENGKVIVEPLIPTKSE